RVLVSRFFFQAEDGIRDYKVTGVQTCALPISGDPTPTTGGGSGPSAGRTGRTSGTARRLKARSQGRGAPRRADRPRRPPPRPAPWAQPGGGVRSRAMGRRAPVDAKVT